MKKEIIIFGTKIPVKTNACSVNGRDFPFIKPIINLFVKITDNCNARCDFCEFHKKDEMKFDPYKLLYVINEIQKVAPINRINFTGGEPTLDLDLFLKTVKLVRENTNAYITLNTNGFRLLSTSNNLTEDVIDSYALSRHHFIEDQNIEIFKNDQIAKIDEIKRFPYKNKLHLRCNMINGYIDSIDKVKEYLDFFADECGVQDFGIVSLWELNNFCKDRYIDSTKINLDKLGSIVHTNTHIKYNKKCQCFNHLYSTSKGNIVSIYTRNDESIGYCLSTLVYDVDVLRTSFIGPAIFK